MSDKDIKDFVMPHAEDPSVSPLSETTRDGPTEGTLYTSTKKEYAIGSIGEYRPLAASIIWGIKT